MKKVTIYQFLLLIPMLFFYSQGYGQQNVKGSIIDQQSEFPLIGATIKWIHTEETKGSVTDIDGYFTIENIPLGRQSFEVSYLGYETQYVTNVEVVAGKETFLNIAMIESLNELEEVVIKAEAQKSRAQNELASVSARTFSLEEVNRYSGGRQDVARLASNYAGVSTSNDNRNDIVIRGNSPTGVLWRLEGIPIPNPNHFSTLGTTGGPVSAINPNVLKNSDFFTGAFPAEYGNALAGVFDLGMRNGNRDQHEFMFQLGAFSGLEAMAEGPLGKGGSYLLAGRYSFIGLVGSGGTAGTSAVPNYKDLSFNIALPKSKIGRIALFGVAGDSDINFFHDDVDEDDLFSANDQDLLPRSGFYVYGLKHNLLIGENAYFRTIISTSSSTNEVEVYRFFNLDTPDEVRAPYGFFDNTERRFSISSYYNQKVNSRLTLRTGVLFEQFEYDLLGQDAEMSPDLDGDGIRDLMTVYELDDAASLIQPFAQVQYRFSENWTLNAGLHAQVFSLNSTSAVEPRLSLVRNLGEGQTLTGSFTIHNQSQPLPILLLQGPNSEGEMVQSNIDLGFTKSYHYVLAYDWSFAPNWRVKAELYHQNISEVPVESTPSSFSLLNLGDDFGFPTDKTFLTNEGTGTNTGIELTLERFFNNGFYGLLTTSIYDSKYKGSDGIERNTAFNNKFIINALGGKEFDLDKNNRRKFTFDARISNAGGRFYTPADLGRSREAGFEIEDDTNAYSEQYPNYFRMDIKLGIKINGKKNRMSQQFFLDFQNVTNKQNIFERRYNRLTNEVNEIDQIGFFPDVLYRLRF